MKKVLKRLLFVFVCVLSISVFLNVKTQVNADEKDLTLSTNDIINGVKASAVDGVASNMVKKDFVKYFVSLGNIDAEKNTIEIINFNSGSDRLSHTIRSACMVSNSLIRLGNIADDKDASIIYQFNALEDMKISVSNNAGTITNDGFAFTVYKKGVDGTITTLKEQTTIAKSFDAMALAGEYDLQYGETLLWVISNTVAWNRDMKIDGCPSFSFVPAKYENVNVLTLGEAIQGVIDAADAESETKTADNAVKTGLFNYYAFAGGVVADTLENKGSVTKVSLSTATAGRLTEVNRTMKVIPDNQISIGNKGTFENYGFVISFDIKKDLTLKIDNAAGSTNNDGLKVNLYKKSADGTIVALNDEVNVSTNKVVEASAFLANVELVSGDTVYWVLSNSQDWERYLSKNAFPTFSFVEKTEFDETLEMLVKMNAPALIKGVVTANQGDADGLAKAAVATRLFDYKVFLGNFDETKLAAKYALTVGTDRLSYADPVIKALFTETNAQLNIKDGTPGLEIIFGFTFKDSGNLVVTNPAGTASNDGLKVKVVKVDASGNLTIVKELTDVSASKVVAENQLGGTFEVAAGDTLYWVLSNSQPYDRTLQTNALPTFEFTNFTYVAPANEQADALKAEKAKYVEADYSADAYMEIVQLFDDAIAACEESTDIVERSTIKNACLEKVSQYLKASEVTAYVDEVSEAINDVIEAFDKNMFKDATYNSLSDIVADFKAKASLLYKKSDITLAMNETITAIRAVEPDNISADETLELNGSDTSEIFARYYNAIKNLEKNYFDTPLIKGQLFSSEYDSQATSKYLTKLVPLSTVSGFGIIGGKDIHSSIATWTWAHDFNNSVQLLNSGYIVSDKQANSNFLLKLTAKGNVHISITSDEWARSTAEHALAIAAYAFVSVDSDSTDAYGYKVWQNSTNWPTALDANWWNIDVDLQEGQCLYLLVQGAAGGQPITCLPKITASAASYDASKVFDIENFIELQKGLASKPEQLQAELDALNADEYEADDYLSICAWYENAMGKDGIFSCQTSKDLETYLAKLYADINNIIKKSEKEAYVSNLASKLTEGLDQASYEEETWNSILALQTKLKEDLNAVNHKDEMDTIYTQAANGVSLIKPDKKESGSIILLASLITLGVAVIAVGTVFILRRKKKH